MKIKPCPHCGGAADLCSNYSRKVYAYFTDVRCEICGAQGKYYTAQVDPETNGRDDVACQNAVTAWNMKTAEGRKMPKNYAYKICPNCGAALDPGEQCDCDQEDQSTNMQKK